MSITSNRDDLVIFLKNRKARKRYSRSCGHHHFAIRRPPNSSLPRACGPTPRHLERRGQVVCLIWGKRPTPARPAARRQPGALAARGAQYRTDGGAISCWWCRYLPGLRRSARRPPADLRQAIAGRSLKSLASFIGAQPLCHRGPSRWAGDRRYLARRPAAGECLVWSAAPAGATRTPDVIAGLRRRLRPTRKKLAGTPSRTSAS